MQISNYETSMGSGSHWSLIVRRGIQLRLTDIQGGANVGALFFNPVLLSEKYNAPDTLKCQHTFWLTRGHCLYSDMGRIFCSVVEDGFGSHDTVCGNIRAKQVEERWGARDYQNDRNAWHQNGHDSFLVEMAKYGLTVRDLAANVNFFSQVQADNDGNVQLVRSSSPGDSITLRFEMDTLVILHSCPHPFSQSSEYPSGRISLELEQAEPIQADDYCMNLCSENLRGFKNNALYHMGQTAGGVQ